MAERLQQLEIPSDITFLNDNNDIPTPGPEDTALTTPELTPSQLLPVFQKFSMQDEVADLDITAHMTFNEVLALSRVYKRVQGFELDAVSMMSSTRSHGWSALSGISSARVSTIAVICLPLHEPELRRFLALQSLPLYADHNEPCETMTPVPTALQKPPRSIFTSTRAGFVLNSGATARLRAELRNIAQDPPPYINTGPIDDDLVRIAMSQTTMALLTIR